jgi:hypothetical protein
VTVLHPHGRWSGVLIPIAVRTGRAITWTPVAAGTAAAIAVSVSQHWLSPAARAPLTLLTATILAASAASVLDDDADPTLAGSPTGLRARTLIRMTWGLAAAAAGWTAAAATVRLATGAAPPADTTLLWCALTTLSLSIGTVTARLSLDVPAGLPASIVLTLGLLLVVLDPPVPPLARLATAAPWDQPWQRLACTVIAATGITLWATRDPAHRSTPATR